MQGDRKGVVIATGVGAASRTGALPSSCPFPCEFSFYWGPSRSPSYIKEDNSFLAAGARIWSKSPLKTSGKRNSRERVGTEGKRHKL